MISRQSCTCYQSYTEAQLNYILLGQVTDKFLEDNPLKQYAVGQTITAKILRKFRPTDDDDATRFVDLTLRPSLMGM